MKEIEIPVVLSEKIQKAMSSIVGKFHDRGYECYLVGGSVRDIVINRKIYDFDFATNAHPGEVIKLFNKVIPTGIKHGTVTVIKDGIPFEITTYRADGKYIDGRRPNTVTFSETLEEDVKRRDFTINGLALDLKKGTVIDYVEGLEDIKKKTIRTIGNPLERFNEDGLRPFRACRLASMLDFTIEPETLDAIKQTLNNAKKISVERVRDEFMKLLGSHRPSTGLEYLRETGLMEIFLPELSRSHSVDQNRFHKYDVYYHSIYSCDAAPEDNQTVRLAALFHDIGKVQSRKVGDDGDYTFYNHEVSGAKMTRKIMKRLKFSNEEIDRVENMILNHMFHYTDEWTDGAVRRFMKKVGIDNIDQLLVLRQADRKGNGMRNGLPAPIRRLQSRITKVIDEENAITVKDLDINGTIIMEKFNLKPGPIIGSILNHLLELVLDDPETNKKEILLQRADEILKNHQ